jgi:hypothetical protein
MNNIFAHFATAYFGVYLKGETDKQPYLDAAAEKAKDGTVERDSSATRLSADARTSPVAGQ